MHFNISIFYPVDIVHSLRVQYFPVDIVLTKGDLSFVNDLVQIYRGSRSKLIVQIDTACIHYSRFVTACIHYDSVKTLPAYT